MSDIFLLALSGLAGVVLVACLWFVFALLRGRKP